MDFIKYINDNWNVSTAKKIAFLNDFCGQYGYQEVDDEGIPNPQTRKEFANEKVIAFFKGAVNSHRKKVVEEATKYEELNFEEVV